MSKGRVLIGVACAALSSALAIGEAQSGKPARDGREAAREMLSRLGARNFTGSIEFEVELTTAMTGESRVRRQHGVLTVDGVDKLRLDVCLEGASEPITCCVGRGSVWMVCGQEGLVFRSGFPFKLDPKAGWRAQLFYQAQQTVRWGEMLLLRDLGALGEEHIESAEVAGERLLIRLSAGAPDRMAKARIVAAFFEKLGHWFPARIEREDGTVIDFGEPRLAGAAGPVPSRINLVGPCATADGRTVCGVSYVITRIDEKSRQQIEQALLGPDRRSEAWPWLLGECVFDQEGRETYRIWN